MTNKKSGLIAKMLQNYEIYDLFDSLLGNSQIKKLLIKSSWTWWEADHGKLQKLTEGFYPDCGR